MASKYSGGESILIDLVRINQIVIEFQAAWAANPNQSVDLFLERLPESLRDPARLHLQRAAEDLQTRPDLQHSGATLPPPATRETGDQPSPPNPRPIFGGTGGAPPLTPVGADDRRTPSPPARDDLQMTTGLDATGESRPAADQKSKAVRPKVKDLHPVIEGFEINCQLGAGAYGVVYRARDTRLDREVAIKVPLIRDSSSRDAYLREARNAARIEHAGIVPIYHVGLTAEGWPFVVQKFIDGSDLRTLLKRFGKLSVAHVLTLIRDIGEALGGAHQQGMIHRDLKPENILLDSKGFPWIADFGLAITDDQQAGRRGELAGTPIYMAPEQVLGKVDWMDGRTDVWAIGVILYELLTGHPPFEAKTYKELAEEIQHRDPRPISQRNEHVPAEVEAIFRRCCAKQLSDRFASTAELVQEIDRVLASVELHDSELGPSPYGHHSPSGAGASRSDSVPRFASRSPTGRSSSRTRTGLSPIGTVGSDALPLVGRRFTFAMALLLILLLLLGLFGVGSLGVIAYQLVLDRLEPQHVVQDIAQGSAQGSVQGSAQGSVQEIKGDAPDSVPTDEQADVKTDVEAAMAIAPEAASLVPLPGAAWIVDRSGNGHATTIGEALAAAEPGATIEIRAGEYRESLTIDRDITLVGLGGMHHVSLSNAGAPVITVSDDSRVVLKNVLVRAEAGVEGARCNAIELPSGGYLRIVDCDFSSSCFNCINARNGAEIHASNTTFRAEESTISAAGCRPMTFADCTFSGSAAGLELIETDAGFDSCQFINCRNWAMSIDDGATIHLHGDCLVEDCGAGIALFAGTCRIRPHIDEERSTTFRGGKVAVRVGPGSVLDARGCLFDRQLESAIYAFLSDARSGGGGAIELISCAFEDCSKAVELQHGTAKLTDCEMFACHDGIVVDGAELTVTHGVMSGLSQRATEEYIPKLLDDPADKTGVGIFLSRGKATLSDLTLSHYNFGIVVGRSLSGTGNEEVLAANLIARRVKIHNYRQHAFVFGEGAKGTLTACSSDSFKSERVAKIGGGQVDVVNCDLQ